MNPQLMVHKANQIALFFASYPREEGVAGVTNHLRMFWEPRMRRQIVAYVEAGGGGLHELVPDAVRKLDACPCLEGAREMLEEPCRNNHSSSHCTTPLAQLNTCAQM